MGRAESRGKAFGSYDPAALNYHISQIRYELGDVSGAIEAMQESDKVRSSVYRRARVRHRATLAERQLEIGHLEAACATWLSTTTPWCSPAAPTTGSGPCSASCDPT
jgi:hypothetical protein